MKLYTPNLKAVKFIGGFDKKLFEIGGRNLLTLKTDDIVVVSDLQALLLLRQPHFEKYDIESIFVNENTQDIKKVDSEMPVPCENIEQFIKTAVIDVIGRFKNEDYLICNAGNPGDNWRVPKDVFESTYRSHELVESGGTIKDVLIQDIIVDENQDIYTLPFLEDLESLELDDVKIACDFVDIKKGNFGIVKLKTLLQPYLKSKDS
ncbi:MAG: hypothetical protein ACI81I_000463 [Arcobacteraceae bacterium]|jgi:hypothetical protein